jgi:hypothetical protein
VASSNALRCQLEIGDGVGGGEGFGMIWMDE